MKDTSESYAIMILQVFLLSHILRLYLFVCVCVFVIIKAQSLVFKMILFVSVLLTLHITALTHRTEHINLLAVRKV